MVKSKQENKPQKQNLPKTRNDWVRQRQAAEGTLGDKKARRRPNRTPASSGYATPPVKSAPDWDADSTSQSPRTQTAGFDLNRRRLGKMSPIASGFRSEPQIWLRKLQRRIKCKNPRRADTAACSTSRTSHTSTS